MHHYLFYILLITCLLFASCASKLRPTGGDKDIDPPVAQSFNPELYSTNFNRTEVIIGFDEFIQLVDPQSQVIISPIIEPAPTFFVKKKSIIITLTDDLKPNTTYNINFGESIVDLHESNVAQNFQYVFSTGSVIDSLSISGITYKAKDNSPIKNAVVMLHKNLHDTAFQTVTPNYITKTDEAGRFILKNISPGSYNIFALLEDNNNYLFDRPDEFIAFQPSPISIPDSGSFTLRLFQSKPVKLQILESSSRALGKHRFIFNLPVKPSELDIKCIEKPVDFRKDYSATNDTLTLWWNDFELEKMKVAIAFRGTALDTIKLSNAKTIKQRGGVRERTVPKLNVKPALYANSFLQRSSQFELNTNNPIAEIDSTKIKFYADSIPLKSLRVILVNSFKAVTDYEFKDDIIYKYQILPGAFTDYFNNTNDTIIQTFSLRPERQYGSMQLNLSSIDPKKENLFLQLIVGEKNVYRQLKITEPQTEISFVEPESYTLRLISDKNNNNRWDTGEYGYGVQPEQILNYSSKINVRANWFMSVDWNVK